MRITEDLDQLFYSLNLHDPDNYYLVAGDWKARSPRWGDITDNQRGKLVCKWNDDRAITFKMKLVKPSRPTFKPHDTYIDFAFIDSRLTFAEGTEKCLTLDYDSDHRANQITLELENLETEYEETEEQHRHRFRKANWSRYTAEPERSFDLAVPNNRNLENDEIDELLQGIDGKIHKAMDDVMPRRTPSNSMEKYTNKKISQLKREKAKLLTIYNRIKNVPWIDRNTKTKVKNQLGKVAYDIKREY